MSYRLLHGDCLAVLDALPDASVQCCVTSPPYWGLRDYGTPEQIGLEKTPQAYVEALVRVFERVRRVLRPDGVLWLNLGDCYATAAVSVGECPGGGKQGENWKLRGTMTPPNRMPLEGLKPKDLVGIPWRVAFALQAAGWWLRSDVIWAKPNPMPESVIDRPTKSHEYLFLLTKSERYAYDAEAIKEPYSQVSIDAYLGKQGGGRQRLYQGQDTKDYASAGAQSPSDSKRRIVDSIANGTGRNKRSVWTVPTQPYAGAHFAVMPEALAEPCILAGSRPGDTVLDPFNGAGTTGVVAVRHGRNYIGIDANAEYLELARTRIAAVAPLFVEEAVS